MLSSFVSNIQYLRAELPDVAAPWQGRPALRTRPARHPAVVCGRQVRRAFARRAGSARSGRRSARLPAGSVAQPRRRGTRRVGPSATAAPGPIAPEPAETPTPGRRDRPGSRCRPDGTARLRSRWCACPGRPSAAAARGLAAGRCGAKASRKRAAWWRSRCATSAFRGRLAANRSAPREATGQRPARSTRSTAGSDPDQPGTGCDEASFASRSFSCLTSCRCAALPCCLTSCAAASASRRFIASMIMACSSHIS